MKKFFEYFTIVIIFSFWGIILTNKEQTKEAVREVKTVAQKTLKIDQPCSKPLRYSIGNVDPKFGVSQDELARLAAQAADVWNQAESRTLIAYDPTSSFKINLAYDNRQEQSNASSQLEQNLQSLETINEALSKQYSSLSSAYQKKVDAYNREVADYKKDIEKYSTTVAYWNSQGGAPEDEYDKLKKEKKSLDEQYNKIDKAGSEINTLAKQTNSLAKKENQIVANYNDTVATYKNQYGDTQEFEKGVFDGQAINIYQFKTEADLRLTLVHELGHYIGIDHVEDDRSIMYYLIGDQEMSTPTLTREDMAALKNICKIN